MTEQSDTHRFGLFSENRPCKSDVCAGNIQPGTILNEHQWMCLNCGAVEDFDDWPPNEWDALKTRVHTFTNSLERIDTATDLITTPVFVEPAAHPKPIRIFDAADLYDGIYYVDDEVDELEDNR